MATLALMPTAAAAAARGCGVRGSKTVAVDAALRIFFRHVGGGRKLVRRYYACDRASGRRLAVGATRPRDDTGLFSNADHWTVAGRWFAHRIVFDGGADQVENIDRQRFGARRQVLDDISEDADGATMARLVIANDGSAAWSLKVAPESMTFKGSLVAAATPSGDPVELGCGPAVRASSLSLAGASLSWIEAGSTRAIAFPAGIPQSPPESACDHAAAAGITAKPTSVAFHAPANGSDSRSVTLSNSSEQSVTVPAAAIAGAGRREFSVSDDHCSGVSLARHATCTITVVFSPPAGAPASASAVLKFDDVTVGLLGHASA